MSHASTAVGTSAAPIQSDADSARFEFGKNWTRFLETVDEERVAGSVADIREKLGTDSLAGISFLDVGSGSGLSSLAAARLGAARVHSFDYDEHSVRCTAEMKRRFAPTGVDWTVERGDALDPGYLSTLGTFDVVYSWGVLHHTGRMWAALDNVAKLVRPGGRLFIAIYNDQGVSSRMWTRVKRLYNTLPRPLAGVWLVAVTAYLESRACMSRALRGRNPLPFVGWRTPRARGMSVWHDYVDWIGGYPFEVAKPEQIFDFHRDRGFVLERMLTKAGGLGCNEFVFRRTSAEA